MLPSLVDAVTALIDALEASEVPYALGGAIALAAWSEPRATVDVDLNIWAEEDALPRAFAVLSAAGLEFDARTALESCRSLGMFQGRMKGYRVDVFVPSVPFYAEALQRRRRVRLAERGTWVLSPECLVVFKLLFFRPKDLVDIARLLEVSGPALDKDFVRLHVARMVGAEDERIARWDELLAGRASASRAPRRKTRGRRRARQPQRKTHGRARRPRGGPSKRR